MKNLLLYTIHKSGSMFLHQLLGEIAKAYRLEHFSMNYPSMAEDIKAQSWVSCIQQHQGIFGPIRIFEARPHTPQDLSQYSVIVHTRDPRDMLTSAYYSFAYSHKIVPGGFNPPPGKREQWQEEGIDRYVLRAKHTLSKYQHLTTELLSKPGVLHVTYEEMVTDYHAWLGKILSACSHLPFPQNKLKHLIGGPPSIEKLHAQLYNKHKDDFSVDQEDIYANKRQITPGDHRRKLQPETIDRLNEIFSEILETLDYPLT
jgi:hypothetical protein